MVCCVTFHFHLGQVFGLGASDYFFSHEYKWLGTRLDTSHIKSRYSSGIPLRFHPHQRCSQDFRKGWAKYCVHKARAKFLTTPHQ